MLSVGDFLGAVSRSCARGRAGLVTRWCLKSRRVGTLVLCIEETSLSITQPHTAYLAMGKQASGVADPAVMSGCRCFASVSTATLMSVRDARHNAMKWNGFKTANNKPVKHQELFQASDAIVTEHDMIVYWKKV